MVTDISHVWDRRELYEYRRRLEAEGFVIKETPPSAPAEDYAPKTKGRKSG